MSGFCSPAEDSHAKTPVQSHVRAIYLALALGEADGGTSRLRYETRSWPGLSG